MGFLDTILFPFKVVIAWLWIVFHDGLTFLGMSESNAWIGGIIGITIVVRAIVLPLMLKAQRSARSMAAIQPELKRIQEKYKGRNDPVSKQQASQETMELYRKYGVNPMASCFPILVQLPVLWALYRVLYEAPDIATGTYARASLGPLTRSVAQNIEKSTFFGAPIGDSFSSYSDPHTRVIAIILVIIYVILMFLSQAWLAAKNIAQGNEQAARMMKIMGYTMPIMMAFIGLQLQIGVLVYWMITMLFSLLQQAGTLRWMPTPGSPAHKKMLDRHQKIYERFKAEEDSKWEKKLEEFGYSEQEIARAQGQLLKARHKGTNTDTALENWDNPDVMRQAVEAREKYQEDLRQRRVKLELETEPPKLKKKGKRTMMDRLTDAQKKAQQMQNTQGSAKKSTSSGRGAQIAAGSRNAQKQPKKKSRAQRQAEAKKRRDANTSLTPEELERRRNERKKQMRDNQKKKRR